MASRGIIYSATGSRFVAEAVASAKSSLRFNPVPHVVFCDHEPEQALEGIEFIRFEPSGNPYLDKIHNIARTPLAETIYLDTDTHVLDNLEDLFDLLRRFDIAATHVAGYTKCDDRGQSEAFYDLNTGVIPFRMTRTVSEFVGNWAKYCEQWWRSGLFQEIQDQAAFRRALWESSLSFYVLSAEYNYRTLFPGRLIGKAKIIHGRHDDYAKVAAQVNGMIRPRLIQALGELPARSWLEEQLAMAQKELGPEHQIIAMLLNRMAMRHETEGNLTEAKPLYERALAICQKNLGAEHPDTAMAYENLGKVSRAIGDHLRAKLFHERALAIREKVLGQGHPDTVRSVTLVAALPSR